MAILEVKVPQLSESVAEATLLQWHKKVGEAVARDENLIDIETDKVVLELPAPSAGVITEIVKGDGSMVVAGEVIAKIDTEASAGAVAPAAAAAAPAPAPAPAASAAPAADPVSAAIAGLAAKASSGVAMPAAAKMLAENKLSATEVAGTGRDGRVTKGDVLGKLEARPAAPAAAPAAPAKAPLPQVAPPTMASL